MSSFYGPLEVLLRDILSTIKPLEEDVGTRVHVINEFKAVVASVQSLIGATVEPFGSFISNLDSRWGDLDISIVPAGSFVSSVGKKRKQNLLRDLMNALRKRGIARNIQFIPNARVPLLIFESNQSSISCDISISNLLGQVKSKFLFWITNIDERFRDMVLLVKEWAKSQNINNPKTGTLNSYSLSLLVIFHFQTCEPAILPPLQEIYAGNIANDLTGVRATAETNIKDICAANIERFRTNNMRHTNRSSLPELFISFFEKFSRINTMAPDYAICTYTGKWERITSNDRWMAKTYPLLIEDPFDQAENAARAVSKNQLIRITRAFEETFHKLSRNQEQDSLITTLVRPQIRSYFFARTQGNLNPHGGDFVHRSQSSTVLPIQNQYQSMPLNSHPSPNVMPQRPWFTSPVHPIRSQFQNMRLDTHPSPNGVSQRHPISTAMGPIQSQYLNRRFETPSTAFPQRPGQGGQSVWRPRSDR